MHVIAAVSPWQHVRVVKESDLKSDGLCPRRFKSCCCRFALLRGLGFTFLYTQRSLDSQRICLAYEVSGLCPHGFDFYRRCSTKTFFGVSVLVFSRMCCPVIWCALYPTFACIAQRYMLAGSIQIVPFLDLTAAILARPL